MEVSKLGFIIWTREAIGGSKVIYRIVYTTLLIAHTHTHIHTLLFWFSNE